MTTDFRQTVKIVRKPKVVTDDRGRTVWSDPIETANLELVSTQMLRQLIESDDQSAKDQIRDAAGSKDGLLAHNTDSDRFEIISDAELQQILDGGHELHEARNFVDAIDEPMSDTADAEEELELVNTELLRQILGTDAASLKDDHGSQDTGFDPYNKGQRS